ncbi:MAG: DUF4212 domain-containing protein [Halolamina sp.]
MEEAENSSAERSVEDARQISAADAQEYWRRNLRLIAGLLTIWFLVSFGAAILLARPLAVVSFGEIPLSFWFAQQGSIIVFVVLIFVYAWRMNKLDAEFGVED